MKICKSGGNFRRITLLDLLSGLPNIALGKKAIQSSTYEGGEIKAEAELAVDGNSDSNVHHNHSSHTGSNDLNPWWAVDFGAPYSVTRVKLVLRDSFGLSVSTSLRNRWSTDDDVSGDG